MQRPGFGRRNAVGITLAAAGLTAIFAFQKFGTHIENIVKTPIERPVESSTPIAPSVQKPETKSPVEQPPTKKPNSDFRTARIGKKALPLLQKDVNPTSKTYGKLVGPQEYLGKVVVLNFWSPDCPPCKREMPEFQKLMDSTNGVQILALQTESELNSHGVINDLVKKGIRFPILGLLGKYPFTIRWCEHARAYDPKSKLICSAKNRGKVDDYAGTYMSAEYRRAVKLMAGIPVTIIIDRTGMIREAFVGATSADDLKERIKKYL